MKMPSTPVLFGIGAAVVVVLVVISKLHSSAPTAAATTATPTASATGVDVGQLSSFESSLTSELGAWEAQQAAGSGSSSSSKTSSSSTTTTPTTATSTSSPSPLPSSGQTTASNPAPVVSSTGKQLTAAQMEAFAASSIMSDVTAIEHSHAVTGIPLSKLAQEEVAASLSGGY